MVKQIGQDIENWDSFNPSLIQNISPDHLAAKWIRISKTANFIADFHTHCFKNPEAGNLISTLTNELIENAVKFCIRDYKAITMSSASSNGHFFFEISNFIDKTDEFQDICTNLFKSDLKSQYIQRLKDISSKKTTHGIGLMLIIKDFKSCLNFTFDKEDDTDIVTVSMKVYVEDYLSDE